MRTLTLIQVIHNAQLARKWRQCHFGVLAADAHPESELTKTIRTLHVKDSESDSVLASRLLAASGYIVERRRVVDEQGLRSALADAEWDVIVADYHLARLTPAAILAILEQTGKKIPVLIVDGSTLPDVAITMIQNELEHERQAVLLREKNALVREIHHRVRNNLQIVSSLLSLHARGEIDNEPLLVLESTKNRIQAMALLHELVCDSEDFALVDLAKYVRQITERLVRSPEQDPETVLLVTEMEPVPVSLDTALPCGIIVNEALQNSLLHGFPEGRTGEVTVRLRERPSGTATLTMADNGIGLPSGMDWTTSQTLGFRLMRALARQLSGELEIRSARGTEVRLRFPVASTSAGV